MKRIISNVMLVAAAATAFFSCQKQEVIVPETEQVSCLTFTSEKPAFADETKTEWTGETIQWSEGDKIRIAYTCDNVWQNADGTATASEEDGYKTAKFYASTELDEASGVAQFDVPGKFVGNVEGEYVFYGIYPSSVVGSSDMKNAPSFNVILPSVQTPLADSFDPESDVMVAQSDVYVGMPEEPISLKWNRKVAHANITLKAVKGITDAEQVLSVKITAQESANMVGLQNYDMLNDEFVKHGDNASANVIELNGTNLSIKEGNIAFWASFLPCTWESFAVEVNTDLATYTRTVETCSLEFKQNARNTLSVKMSGDDVERTERVAEVSATLTFDNTSKRTSLSDDKQVWEENGITFTNNKSASTNKVADYSKPARVYANSNIVVEAPGNITQIVFDCNSTSYATALKNSVGAEATVSSDKVTVTLTSPAEMYTIAKLTAQVRLDAMTVTYQTAGGGETPEVEPELNVAATSLKIDAVEAVSTIDVNVKALYNIEANAFADEGCTTDCNWLAAEWTSEGISYRVAENETNELRNAYIQITALDSNNEEYSEVISISQATTHIAELTIEEFLKKEVHPYMWYQLTGVMSNIVEGNKFGNFDITDETGTVYVYGLTKTKSKYNDQSFEKLGLKNNDELTLVGTRAEYGSTAQVGGPAYYVDHVAVPYIDVTPATINVSADDTEATFTVDSNVDWDVISEDVNDWDIADDGTVTVYFSENTTSEEVQYTVTITSELDDVVVVIKQAGMSGENDGIVVLSEQFDNNSSSDNNNAITNSTFSNFSGATDKAYKSQYGGIKLGSSKAAGYITSKSLDLSSSFTVQLDACKYSSDTGNITVTVGSQTKTIKNSELGAAGSFKTFTLSFDAATANSTVKIATSSKRAYIDNVVITRN